MKMKGSNGKPKMKDGVVQKPKKSKKLELAEEAVGKYVDMKEILLTTRQQFEKNFPKAFAKLQEIKQIEDDVRDQIEACKILVRDAGQSVGEFTCVPKFTSEGYIGTRILELVSKLPPHDAGVLLKELFTRGFIKDLSIDKAAAKVIRASDQDLRDRLEDAWDKGGTPLTNAVTAPKI